MYLRTVKLSVSLLVLIAASFTLFACSSADSETETGSDSITDIVWQWESLTDRPAGETTTVPNPENYTLAFRDDGTFSGQADCNQISGTYTQEGGFTLSLGPSTMAFCGEDSLDQQYLDLLNGVVAGGPDGAGGFALEWAGAEKRMEFSNGGAA
jgi:heat shock protein HslJ